MNILQEIHLPACEMTEEVAQFCYFVTPCALIHYLAQNSYGLEVAPTCNTKYVCMSNTVIRINCKYMLKKLHVQKLQSIGLSFL